MSRPIRILDLRDSPWVDGPGRTILETASSLDRKQYSVVIGGFCIDNIFDSEYLNEALRRSLIIQPIVERRALDWKIIPQILGAIVEHQIDIVHTHDFRSNVAGFYCARRHRLPVISSCHGWIANNLRGSVKKSIDIQLLSRFDQIVTVSSRLKEDLIAGGIDSRRIDVIVNALIVDNFKPDTNDNSFRRGLGIADSGRLIANIGRLSAEKGQAILIDAVARVCGKRPDIRLVFVGIGPDEDRLKAQVNKLGLSNVVYFAGYCSDMPVVYNSADLVVQSSMTEGMPNVILESLLMKTPVVATDVGGTAEIITHGQTGHLVSANSVQSIVDGILDFLVNETKHREMASRGRDVIRKNFDHKLRVTRFENLYSRTLSHGRP